MEHLSFFLPGCFLFFHIAAVQIQPAGISDNVLLVIVSIIAVAFAIIQYRNNKKQKQLTNDIIQASKKISSSQEVPILKEPIDSYKVSINASINYSLGDYEKAIKYYDGDIESNTNADLALTGKGKCLFLLGRFDEAIECYNKALEINPDRTDTWFNKALALEKSGKREEAEECFNKAKELGLENGL